MTKGALIFAYNNEHVDYVSMASWSAKRIRRHLDIPVCVVTDQDDRSLAQHFDKIIVVPSQDTQTRHFSDFKQHAVWHNGSRVSAYELSPWDHTLVLDADYVLCSDQLRWLFDTDYEFLCHDWATDVSGGLAFEENNHMGQLKFPMLWATVMCFKKTLANKLLFESMQMIKQNWTHYLNIYKFKEHTYRNDYALSIAVNLIQGHTLQTTSIPWNLITVTPNTGLQQLDEDQFRIDFLNSENKPQWLLVNQDFHAMSKQALISIVSNDH